jgi:outer membrane receptor protein involved in Fe transport
MDENPATRAGGTCRQALLCAALAALPQAPALAGGQQTLEPVEITGSVFKLIGAADSASEGTVTQQQITTRPWLRPAEVLETVPGLIVTQHTGDGKANQYFLRGFNLDHGTDFATYALGMPINLPTHAHGQGYTDLNFLIPELISTVRYRKGPYSAQQGDFGAAGSASIDYLRQLPASFGEIGVGQRGFRRLLAATSPQVGAGNLLFAGEAYRNDGPWDVPQDYRKNNGVLRYAQGSEREGFDVTLLAYDAKWNATDQVALRAIEGGPIGRFGTLDATTGGETSRYSLSAQWSARDAATATRAVAYAVRYRLDLFSNFTYFLDNPDDGDQFEQRDRRTYFGGAVQRTWFADWGGRAVELTAGAVLRQDNIDKVGLYLTAARQRLQTVRADDVMQRSFAAFGEASVQWAPWLRTIVGLRYDDYRFDVSSDLPANSGKLSEAIVTPKFQAVFGPFDNTEFYAAYGQGFHSNDARGATIRVNPDPRAGDFGEPVDPVSPLVRAKGSEIGVRGAWLPNVQAALAFWRLDLDSELLFVGDAGTTEASRPSRREGVEWANYWTPLRGLIVDADLTWSRARFTDNSPQGDRIPGAIERTASLGIAFDDAGPYYGGLRLRYFGPRPLVEDNSVRSASSTLVNARAGWRIGRGVELVLDVLNLLDRQLDDIEYFYESRLRGEPAPVADRHVHPAEPRTVRLALRVNF